jgi:hypothetical protein
MTHILFAVPTNAGIDPHTVLAITKIKQRPDVDYLACTGSPTDQVRNGLARKVLDDPGYTHLLMMDSDIEPPDDIVDQLLGCNAAMAAAIVPICVQKMIVTNIVMPNENPDDPDTSFMMHWSTEGEPIEAEGAGTGIVLIRREVFEKVPWPWFRYKEAYPEGKRTGEDIYFSKKAAKYGFKYKVPRKSLSGHFKTMDLRDIINGYTPLNKTIMQQNETITLLKQQIQEMENK